MLKYPQGLNKQIKNFSGKQTEKKVVHNAAKSTPNMVKSKSAVKFGKRGMKLKQRSMRLMIIILHMISL